MKNYRAVAGFTLIELLVTVAIIGTLTAIAIPSYFNSVKKTNRVEAKTFMLEAVQSLQRCYTAYGRYNHASCDIYNKLSDVVGLDTASKYYAVTIGPDGNLPPTSNYKMTATAKKNGPQDKDKGCQTLFINQAGQKSPEECW
ncbi:MAG TPA: type IV pilin protein [Cellvibrio sp.]|nr:type IV pilin protein [Cellvibrio sp.]